MKPTPLLLTCLIGLAVPMVGLDQPKITVQPQNQTNVSGSTLALSVEANGTLPLVYQWQKYGGFPDFYDLADRTNVTLVLTNVVSSDAGDYRVIVTNADGAITSDVAHLTVLVPPRITPTVSLQHTSVSVGSTASFSVTSFGTAPLSYQWRLDDRELLGQTNKTLTRTSTQSSDEGDYTVVVTNGAGSVISDPARLWVVPPISSLIRKSDRFKGS